MNFLNIGPAELLVLGLVLLIVFGPERLPSEAKKAARWVRSLMRTETYRDAAALVKTMRELPRKVMQEAQLEDLERDIAAFERSVSATDPGAPRLSDEAKPESKSQSQTMTEERP